MHQQARNIVPVPRLEPSIQLNSAPLPPMPSDKAIHLFSNPEQKKGKKKKKKSSEKWRMVPPNRFKTLPRCLERNHVSIHEFLLAGTVLGFSGNMENGESVNRFRAPFFFFLFLPTYARFLRRMIAVNGFYLAFLRVKHSAQIPGLIQIPNL